MANICSTDITLRGPKEELDRIYSALEAVMKSDDHWSARLLIESGLYKTIDEMSEDHLYVRGSISNLDYTDDNTISVSQEDNWSPQLDGIKLVCEALAPNVEIVYKAEEPGCGFAKTNSDDIVGDYFVDVWEPENLSGSLSGFCWDQVTEDNLRDALLEYLGFESSDKDTESLIALAQQESDYAFVAFQYQYCALEDLTHSLRSLGRKTAD